MKSESSETAWRDYIKHLLANSPVFDDLLRDHPGWWPRLQAEVKSLRAE